MNAEAGAEAIVDPLEGPAYGIDGRVVSMNDDHDVLASATLWIERGVIRAVTASDAARPPGFDAAPLVRTGGTIYPGMIELHNHLPYNILRMWDVPELYGNRSQWGRHEQYRRLVSGPMNVLGKTAGFIEAIVRYVEVKALAAGVTTSQGIALFSNANTRRYHRGLVRNVEDTDDEALPEADSRVADVDDAASFLTRLQRGKSVILHLAEGVDDGARRHFQALQTQDGRWAISDRLIGIHAAGLTEADMATFASHGGAMVWSPSSNLMLYGGTAAVAAARREGVTVALGSDWSPTGSKNLLREVQVARAVADVRDLAITDRDLVDMVTRNPARALRWDGALGSLGPGRRADLVVLSGKQGDPYQRLLQATERSVVLVAVNGVIRYGQPRYLPAGAEQFAVDGARRALFLDQASVDPIVAEVTFAEAVTRLEDGLSRLPELAAALEAEAGPVMELGGREGVPPVTVFGIARAGDRWVLELEDEEPDGTTTRPELGVPEIAPVPVPESVEAAAPLSEILEPLELDPLTVIDDRGYARRLRTQRNIPPDVAAAL
jgi:cytosine/adenosine deaminase-related metal-dependent hydrolase